MSPKPRLTREQAAAVLAQYLSPTAAGDTVALESDWSEWLTTLYDKWVSSYVTESDGIARKQVHFGDHQKQFWNHVWSIRQGIKPNPFVASWPRGGAKSTSAELACVALGARGIRRYALYISATQEQADDHIQNIAALLESPRFAEAYPAASRRDLNKYGSSKGWRRSRVRAANGFTADAIGLDTAARGVKLDDQRPDLIILDDLDEELDSPAATDKKILVLTHKLLPAGAGEASIIAIQNLIISDGIFARLCGIEGAGKADFLQDRVVSGPFPAIFDPTIIEKDGKSRLIAGKPLWLGQSLEKCQQQINEWGISAWRVEAQQEVDTPPGGLFSDINFDLIHVEQKDVPELIRVVVWVDPAVTSTDKSDSHGIHADGLGIDGLIYRLRSWEHRATPAESLRRAFKYAVALKAEHIGVETDQGGDVWEIAYNAVWEQMVKDDLVPEITTATLKPNFVWEKAGAGFGPKTHRAARMLVDYENGRFRHVVDPIDPTHPILERALKRFPIRKPYDLTDAAFWAWHDLKEGTEIGSGASFDPPVRMRGVSVVPPMPPSATDTSLINPTNSTSANPIPSDTLRVSAGRLWQGHRGTLFHAEQEKNLAR